MHSTERENSRLAYLRVSTAKEPLSIWVNSRRGRCLYRPAAPLTLPVNEPLSPANLQVQLSAWSR